MPSFACPHCHKALRTTISIPSNKRIKCPGCGEIFAAPAGVGESESKSRPEAPHAEKTKSRKAGHVSTPSPMMTASLDDDDDDSDKKIASKKPAKPAKKKGGKALLVVVLLLLLLGAAGGVAAYVWPGYLLEETPRQVVQAPKSSPSAGVLPVSPSSTEMPKNDDKPAVPGDTTPKNDVKPVVTPDTKAPTPTAPILAAAGEDMLSFFSPDYFQVVIGVDFDALHKLPIFKDAKEAEEWSLGRFLDAQHKMPDELREIISDVDRIIVGGNIQDDTGLFMVHTRNPYDIAKLKKFGEFKSIEGKNFFQSDKNYAATPTDHLILITSNEKEPNPNAKPTKTAPQMLESALALANAGDSGMRKAHKDQGVPDNSAVWVIGKLTPMMGQMAGGMAASMGEKLPPDLKPALEIVPKLRSASLSIDSEAGAISVRFRMQFPEAGDSDTLAKTVNAFWEKQGKDMLAFLPVAFPVNVPTDPNYGTLVESVKQSFAFKDAGGGSIKGEVVFSPAAAAEVGKLARIAAGKVTRADIVEFNPNMKAIGLGLHRYHDANRKLPKQFTVDQASKQPGLSWRVSLLPFVGQEELYKEFHLDESWDSPHNKQLIAKMPDVYKSVRFTLPEGKTGFQVVAGPNTAFDGERQSNFYDFKDGVSQTILVLETSDKQAVTWTQPVDLAFDQADLLSSVATPLDMTFPALFADGTIHELPVTVTLNELRAYLTPSGGEAVRRPE